MMTKKVEYDFLTWASFPSSIKLLDDEKEAGGHTGFVLPNIAVTPGSTIKLMVKAKQNENALFKTAHLAVNGWDGTAWRRVYSGPWLPLGYFDWTSFESSFTVPPDIKTIIVITFASAGSPEAPGITWFDDLKVCQDDKLIYADDFSKWDPVIGAGVGAGILGVVVPAVVRVPEPGVAYEYQKPLLEKEPLLAAGLAGLGILVGGGIGLLTGLGIVPVPQIPIPTFGATPEEPGAPARLGKYQITG